jgi:small nuclear ribonucleoprotein (snRNP)-like protein
MDKKLFVHLQGGRKVSGTLRGYDLFLNLVIDDAVEETTPAQKHPIGTVVWLYFSLFFKFDFLIYSLGHPRKQCHIDGDIGSYSFLISVDCYFDHLMCVVSCTVGEHLETVIGFKHRSVP